MQGSSMGWRVVAPNLPGCQKVQAGSEAAFGNSKAPAPGNLREALRQLVMLQKNVAGFLQAVVPAEVNIAKPL